MTVVVASIEMLLGQQVFIMAYFFSYYHYSHSLPIVGTCSLKDWDNNQVCLAAHTNTATFACISDELKNVYKETF